MCLRFDPVSKLLLFLIWSQTGAEHLLEDGDEQVDQQDVGDQQVTGHDYGSEPGSRDAGRKLLPVFIIHIVSTRSWNNIQ